MDAERAFLGGRLTVNHLRHGVSSQTFKEQIALGLWIKLPALNVEDCVGIIKNTTIRTDFGDDHAGINMNL